MHPDGFYHVYNRTNNQDLLFVNEENRRFFMQQYEHFLGYLTETCAWCLIPNHFHFLIKTKTKEAAITHLSKARSRELSKTEKLFLQGKREFYQLINKAFTRFFQSYSEAFNNVHKRKGNLFYSSFKCQYVANAYQLRNTILYIHSNPIKHGLVSHSDDFKWCSWNIYKSAFSKNTVNKTVYEIFESKSGFILAHEAYFEAMRNGLKKIDVGRL